jgi:hypothetical protein
MNFVDADWRVECVGLFARRIGRQLVRHGRHDAGGGRPQLGVAGIRIGLQRQQVAFAADDFVLVAGTGRNARQEDFPHAAFAAQTHGMAAAVPLVEVTHHADTLGVGRPYGEAAAGYAVAFSRRGAECFEGPQMRAFGEQPRVHFAEHLAEAVRIVLDRLAAVGPADAQPVGAFELHRGFEQAVVVHAGELLARAVFGGVDHRHFQRTGLEGADPGCAIGIGVRAEHGERIAVAGLQDLLDIGQREHVESLQRCCYRCLDLDGSLRQSPARKVGRPRLASLLSGLIDAAQHPRRQRDVDALDLVR